MRTLLPLFLGILPLVACVPADRQVFDLGQETQLQKRGYQSRLFDTGDKEKVLRAIIATMQDMGFIIDDANLDLGTVSGSKRDPGYAGSLTRMSVSARPRGENRMLVRANAQYELRPVTDPRQYQNFFAALARSLFLHAEAVE